MNILIFILLSCVSGYAQCVDSFMIKNNIKIHLPCDLINTKKMSLDNFVWDGAVINGKASGEGSLTYNGRKDTIEIYKGSMEKGYFHGEGKYTYLTGAFFTGTFKEGFKEGLGVLNYGFGSHRIEGTWVNDKLNGVAKEIGIAGNSEESYRIMICKDNIIEKKLLEFHVFTLDKFIYKEIEGQPHVLKKVYYSQDTLDCFQELHICDQYEKGILRIVLYYPEGGFEPYRIAIYKGNTYGPFFNEKTVLLSMDVTFSNIGDLISYDVNYFKGKCFLKKNLHLLHLLNCRGDNVHQLTWEEILAASKKPKFSWARHDRLIRQKEREEKQRISSQENMNK